MGALFTKRSYILGLGFLLLLAVLGTLFIGYMNGGKEVVLIVDGKKVQVETRKDRFSELLQEQQIHVEPHDWLSAPLSSKIHDGSVFEMKRAIPIKIIDQGKEMDVFATQNNVAELLHDLKVEVGNEDEVVPGPQTRLINGLAVRIVRVEKQIETVHKTIPYQTIEKRDKDLLKGKTELQQKGKEGLLVLEIEKVWKDNKLVSERVVEEEVAVEKKDEIVAIGTRVPVEVLSASSPTIKEVTKENVSFGVKKVLENVTVTAYDAGVNSTGKSEDHPKYGVTYTGKTVQEGRTVAVDPDIIPLGWWLYIEGIGFRRAEDIGSAIKGKKIDVYMDSETAANQFGLQKGYTVYVIGPNKPAALQ